ncbi:MAG: sigma 54-interacting transcriptional regulator [Polyangia bacterium]|nr:sigma 54-interacting transcriptional regulator [Polyangia bacterium]
MTRSPAMQSVNKAIEEACRSDCPVLLLGEQGVGKEFVARLIHRHSPRTNRAFETLFPPALTPELAAQELHAEQARRLRQAAGGTLLVKEVWRFPSAARRRLGEALDHQQPGDRTPLEVHDVRLMLSSRVSLEEPGHEHWLGAVEEALPLGSIASLRRITIPPLRRRPADIPLLVETFNREQAQEARREPLQFSSKAMDRLSAHDWPGNVSEVRSVVYRLFGAVSDQAVEPSHLSGLIPDVEDEIPLGRFGLEELVRAKLRSFLGRIRGYHVEDLLGQVMSQVERPLLELVLEQTRGNQLQAARILGINRNTLRKRIRALSIKV